MASTGEEPLTRAPRREKASKAPHAATGKGAPTSPYPAKPIGIANPKGGPVMSQPIGVYITWMGAFSAGQKGLVRSLIASLSRQPGDPTAGTGGALVLPPTAPGGRCTLG